MRIITTVILGLVFSATVEAKSPATGESVTKVDCDKGQLLGDAVNKAAEGETIEVSGNCNEETVIVYTDRIKIRGVGGTVIDSSSNAAIVVSARMVELINFEIHKGIVVQEHSSVWIQGVTATNTTSTFPAVFAWYAGYAWIYQSQVVNNLGTGVRAESNSTIDIEESTISNNGKHGVELRMSGVVRLRDNVIDNNLHGINLGVQSSAQFRGHNTISNNSFGMICSESGAYQAGIAQTFVGNNTQVHSSPGCHAELWGGVTIP